MLLIILFSLQESASQKQISPALQETDSSLLESICAQPELITTKLDDKDINLKTGTKIADSILQKFNMIKSKVETKPEAGEKEVKTEPKVEKIEKEESKEKPAEAKPKVKQEPKAKTETKKASPAAESSCSADVKKRPRKVVSREFIDSDGSDSSDSEQLVIARSDEDSQQTNMFEVVKVDSKESDSNASFMQQTMTDDSRSQDEEPRNFKFEKSEESDSILPESSSDNVKVSYLQVQGVPE